MRGVGAECLLKHHTSTPTQAYADNNGVNIEISRDYIREVTLVAALRIPAGKPTNLR